MDPAPCLVLFLQLSLSVLVMVKLGTLNLVARPLAATVTINARSP
jgi:hypothetical protein